MLQVPGKPVVFLTFANAAEQGYLNQLKKESGLLRDLFLPLHQKGEIELVREESLDSTELPKLFNQYKGRICIFHYGGHAGGRRLSLEDGQGHFEGLAELLSLQTGLNLVFLNGCSTQGQAKPYLEAGIPVVLATSRSIPDEEATFFAEHFYHALLNQHTIREAFKSASGALRTRSAAYQNQAEGEVVVYRQLAFRGKELAEMPWRLYVQEGNETTLNWSLGQSLKQGSGLNENESAANNQEGMKQRAWRWIVGVGIIIGILAGIAGFTGFDLKSLMGMAQAERPLQLTVYVHGPEGRQDIVLENEGTLVLDLRNDRRVAQIGEHGRTNFGEIGNDFLGKAVPLSIEAQGFTMAHPDTAYIYDGEPIYLEVTSSCRFCNLSGTVQGQAGQLLPGLLVMIKGTELADTTGQNGQFQIQVPPEKEREEYILSVVRDGRIIWENYVTPSPESPIEILLPQ